MLHDFNTGWQQTRKEQRTEWHFQITFSFGFEGRVRQRTDSETAFSGVGLKNGRLRAFEHFCEFVPGICSIQRKSLAGINLRKKKGKF
jgi:hypothetical protein